MERKNNVQIKNVLKKLIVFIMAFVLLGTSAGIYQVNAASQLLTIKSCSTENSSCVYIKTHIEKSDCNTVDVYRSESANGPFELRDTFLIGGLGGFVMDGKALASGQEGRMQCYTTVNEDDTFWRMEGDVTFKDGFVKTGKRYFYRFVMKRYSSDQAVFTSGTASVKIDLVVPTIKKSLSTDGKSVKITWKRSGNARGYQVYRYDAAKRKWKLYKTIKGSKNTFTDKKVKAGKKYKYKIRAYGVADGKTIYSKFSSIHTISLKKPTVKGNYKRGSVYGPSLNNKELLQVRRAVESFKTNYIKKGMSDYDKAWAAFHYLRSNCDYAYRGWQYHNANSAWGALVYGEAQCSGYARAMKALCDGIGVKCYYVHANAKADNPSHQWNEVRVGGKWYIVDAQSGFFLVGSKTWKERAGMQWNTKGLPKCSVSDHKKSGFYGSYF